MRKVTNRILPLTNLKSTMETFTEFAPPSNFTIKHAMELCPIASVSGYYTSRLTWTRREDEGSESRTLVLF